MQISDGMSTHVLAAGQYIALPKGNFTITHLEIVELVCVLELPEQVWALEKKLYAISFRPRLQQIDYRPAEYPAARKGTNDDA